MITWGEVIQNEKSLTFRVSHFERKPEVSRHEIETRSNTYKANIPYNPE